MSLSREIINKVVVQIRGQHGPLGSPSAYDHLSRKDRSEKTGGCPSPKSGSQPENKIRIKGEAEILLIRRVWSTESKALERFKATTAIWTGGLFWLNPMMAWLTMGRRAVVVDLKGVKPCWVEALGREVRSKGCTSFSSILATGDRREMGDVLRERGFPGLGTGIITADFQIAGKFALLTEKLNRCVE
jgi:hypothetical protein